MWSTLRNMMHLLGEESRSQWILLTAVAVLASGLEMAGALLIYILLAVIANPDVGGDFPLIGGLAGGGDERSFLLLFASLIGAFFVLRALTQIGIAYAKHRLAQNAGARLSSRLMRGYLELPYDFHLTRNSSELVRNAHTTVREISQQGFLQAIYVVAEGALILGLLIVMVAVAPAATALAVLVMGSAAGVLLKVVQPRLKRQGVVAQEMEKRTLSAIQQSLYGVRDIKLLNAQAYFGEVYRKYRLRQSRALYVHGTIAEAPRNVIELALFGFILTFFSFSLFAGSTTEELLATLGLFAYAGLRLIPSVQKLVGGLNHLQFAGPAIENIYDDHKSITAAAAAHSDGPDTLELLNRVTLEDVEFRYEGAQRPALDAVNLTIERGLAVGICGPTGGGKTTLIDVISGLLVPTRGKVCVDGSDLRGREREWYRQLGVVPQTVFLTDDSLRRNIALGTADEDIDEEALSEAVDLAQLTDFVGSLPRGLGTFVGERGVRLSGGQRQRVAIARALYRRPSVIVFDEGTSALDNATEGLLMSSLERLRGERTVLMVAHRLSTVRSCDKVVYMENGGIAGSGTFDYLRETCDGFRSLARGM